MNRHIEGIEFAKAPCMRIIKNSNNSIRVSDEAGYALSKALGDIEVELAEIAMKYTYGRGKKTIQKEDIVNAVSEWRDK